MKEEEKKVDQKGQKETVVKKQTGKKGSHGSKKGYRKPQREVESSVPTSTNPVEWYYLTEQMGKDAANIPFNVLTGKPINIYPTVTANGAVPGILALRVVQGVGSSNYSSSTINTAIRSIYSWVRHQNSGHSNYEAPDLGIYILAMSELYSAYFEAVRIYKVAMTYKWVNRYIPDSVLRALGAQPKSIRENLAQYRAGLNIIAAKLSSLAVPQHFTTFQRYAMLFSNIYLDGKTDRGQYYVFTRYNGRKFDGTQVNGGKLVSYELTGDRTFTEILTEMNTSLDKILADEDFNIMSGDIIKAYGSEALYVVPSVDEMATIEPVYDETILSQIENATVVGGDITLYSPTSKAYSGASVTPSSLDITQRDGYIVYSPSIAIKADDSTITDEVAKTQFGNLFNNMNRIFNSHKDSPDWKDALEGSRLMCNIEISDIDSIPFIESGSEFVAEMQLWTLEGNTLGVNASREYVSQWMSLVNTNSAESTTYAISVSKAYFKLAAFDWHPFIYFTTVKNDGTFKISDTEIPVGDYHVYAVLSRETIRQMHNCALLAQFRTKLLK